MKRPKQASDRINRINKIFSLFPEETTKYESPAAKKEMLLPRSGDLGSPIKGALSPKKEDQKQRSTLEKQIAETEMRKNILSNVKL
jgi:hypothetical protein